MQKIILLAAATVGSVGLAEIKLNSLEIRTSLKSNDPGVPGTDQTLGFSLNRAMWIQDGEISNTEFDYSFEVNFKNAHLG